ncbi:NUDIX hydrolase [Nonomuraea angiospora]|uniref:NUDIX hydrolase n=1 Tax=Nonomuraea angiospora TaxID=46172 RepID=UPI00343E11C1
MPFAQARAAAGVLFFDEAGHVLLVRPTYKPYMDIPGGYVEPGETPHQACVREVREELGIQPAIGRLLVVDWAPLPQAGGQGPFRVRRRHPRQRGDQADQVRGQGAERVRVPPR